MKVRHASADCAEVPLVAERGAGGYRALLRKAIDRWRPGGEQCGWLAHHAPESRNLPALFLNACARNRSQHTR